MLRRVPWEMSGQGGSTFLRMCLTAMLRNREVLASRIFVLYRANGRGRSGGQTAGGDPEAFPRLEQPLFAVPALRELESACRVSIL